MCMFRAFSYCATEEMCNVCIIAPSSCPVGLCPLSTVGPPWCCPSVSCDYGQQTEPGIQATCHMPLALSSSPWPCNLELTSDYCLRSPWLGGLQLA